MERLNEPKGYALPGGRHLRLETALDCAKREFQEEKKELLRQKSFEQKKSTPKYRRKLIEKCEEELKQLGVVLGNDRAINIPDYNQHFKGKSTYF